jgi:hypothetical protein
MASPRDRLFVTHCLHSKPGRGAKPARKILSAAAVGRYRSVRSRRFVIGSAHDVELSPPAQASRSTRLREGRSTRSGRPGMAFALDRAARRRRRLRAGVPP